MNQMIGGFFTQEIWLLPNWAWFVIFIGVACLLIAAILVTCLLIKNKKSEGGPAEDKGEMAEEEKPESKEESKEVKEEVKEEAKTEEKKPAKSSEKKSASTKSTAKATEEKNTAKSTAAKKEEKAEAKEEAASEIKVYHISKRKEDGKWQVKAEGADRALRLFFTQADAIAYAKKVAGNQEGRIVIHKESGGFRKINY